MAITKETVATAVAAVRPAVVDAVMGDTRLRHVSSDATYSRHWYYCLILGKSIEEDKYFLS